MNGAVGGMPIHRKPLPVNASLPTETKMENAVAASPFNGRYLVDHNATHTLPKDYEPEVLVDGVSDIQINHSSTLQYISTELPEVTTSKKSEDSICESDPSTCSRIEPYPAETLISKLESTSWPGAAEKNSVPHSNAALSSNILGQGIYKENSGFQTKQSKRQAKVTSILQDASLFMGGLIAHPIESTRHFTILRHNHGLVYYRGPTTSVSITVFADQPLPLDRRYWLQMKGWTGDTGMRTKAFLGTNNSWINVTPARKAMSNELPPMDERAWQRDIRKLQDEGPGSSKSHIARETAVIRVPFEALDGYFRIVLTGANNKSPLCTSPVFRVASTSMSAGSIKGASLSTLPIELSVKLLQFAAHTVTSNAVAPFAESARRVVASALPSAVSQYGQTAYDLSNTQNRIDALEQQYYERREQTVDGSANPGGQYYPLARPNVVGNPNGPELPFPVRFEGRVMRGSGNGAREVGMPTANLDSVASDAIARLDGVYFGWSFVTPEEKSQVDLHPDWHRSIITIAYDHSIIAVARRKVVRVYLMHDFAGEQFYGAKMSLVIMGYLRPTIPNSHKQAFFTETARDIEITHLSLDREQWQPNSTLQRIETAKSDRSFTDRYIDVRTGIQRLLDTAPIHHLGVRNESVGMIDRALYGNGGLYITRGTG